MLLSHVSKNQGIMRTIWKETDSEKNTPHHIAAKAKNLDMLKVSNYKIDSDMFCGTYNYTIPPNLNCRNNNETRIKFSLKMWWSCYLRNTVLQLLKFNPFLNILWVRTVGIVISNDIPQWSCKHYSVTAVVHCYSLDLPIYKFIPRMCFVNQFDRRYWWTTIRPALRTKISRDSLLSTSLFEKER